MIQIQKTSDLKIRKLNLLVYGPPGSGKTRFAGTSAAKFKPLILSAESGLLSLQSLGSFDYVKIEKWEQVDEIRMDLRHGKLKYDTVILDSITEIQQVCMDRILREERLEKARIQDWGTLAQRMITAIRDFRDMDHNLIVTALADSIQDEEAGTQRTIPMVQGQLKEKLAAYFDEVFYLLAKPMKNELTKETTIQRTLLTQGTQKILAKDRSGLLLPQEAPDFCSIYQKIFNPEKNPCA